MVEPSKCSLDPPAPRQQDDRQDEWEAMGDPLEQAPTVSTIAQTYLRGVMDAHPPAIAAPAAKVRVHGAPRRAVPRQRPLRNPPWDRFILTCLTTNRSAERPYLLLLRAYSGPLRAFMPSNSHSTPAI